MFWIINIVSVFRFGLYYDKFNVFTKKLPSDGHFWTKNLFSKFCERISWIVLMQSIQVRQICGDGLVCKWSQLPRAPYIPKHYLKSNYYFKKKILPLIRNLFSNQIRLIYIYTYIYKYILFLCIRKTNRIFYFLWGMISKNYFLMVSDRVEERLSILYTSWMNYSFVKKLFVNFFT